MEIFIKEHKEDNYGKVVKMSSLFAALMISLGKAVKKPAGAKIGDLYLCSLCDVVIKTGEVKDGDKTKGKYHIYEDDYRIMIKENLKEGSVYTSPLSSSVIFMYEDINKTKTVDENVRYVNKVIPLKNVMQWNHLWKKDWDDETYLTNECLNMLNQRLWNIGYKINRGNKEIII